jgi:hypothetical protein
MRLTINQAEIKATVSEIIRTLDRKLKGVVAGGNAQDLIDVSSFPEGTVYRPAVGQEPGNPESGKSEIAGEQDEDLCVYEATRFFWEPSDATGGGMKFEP